MNFSKAVIVGASEPVSKAISKLKSTGLCALVFDGNKYLGVIDERALREKKTDTAKTSCASMAMKTPVLAPDASVQQICRAFFAGRFKTIPVMDNSEVLGVVGRWDILEMLEKGGYLKGHKVSSHMTSPIMTVDAHASVSSANAIMREANVRRLAVIENGRLVGVISVFDLLPTRATDEKNVPKADIGGKEREKLPVYSFMNEQVETIESDAPLSQAVRDMFKAKRAALIVVDGNRPVGIITAKDVLGAVVATKMQLPVVVSGLHGAEKAIYDDVVAEGEKILKKLKSICGTGSLMMHIKETGSEFFVSAHAKGGPSLRSHASEHSLMDAVRCSLDELMEQARRYKSERISKRKN